ncbi:13914_t:CDS:10, partial [Dentiscutata heterogama]
MNSPHLSSNFPSDMDNNISTLHTSEPDSYASNFIDPNRIVRSRRNTFAYGSSQLPNVPLQPTITGSSSTNSHTDSHSVGHTGSYTDSHCELVPYSKEWTVIMRSENAGQLVLYNTTNRRVSVRRLNNLSNQALSSPHMCALCRRPLTTTSGSDFMHRNYFRLLENSENVLNGQSTSTFVQPTSSTHSFSPYPTTTSFPEPITENISSLSESSFNQGYYQRFFIEERKLGRGSRGSVFLCKHVLDNVHLGEYAIKKVAVGDNHSWLVKMLREVHLLERLKHPNIIDYKHAWLEHHQLTNFVPCLFILMERANGGNLEEFIDVQPSSTFSIQKDSNEHLSHKERFLHKKRMWHTGHLNEQPTLDSPLPSKRFLDLREICYLFMDICEGLAHLHKQGIIHRDLKPSNLLLQYDDPNDLSGIVLISDFGECEIIDQLTERDRTGATGTLEFMAPELITVDDRGRYLKEYSQKSDMWSLGMVLYYLCYSRLPYRQIDDVDLLKQEIIHFNCVSFPDNGMASNRRISSQLRSLITCLLSRNAKSRPSCDEILKSVADMRSAFVTGETIDVTTDPFKVTPILDSSSSASSSQLEPEKLTRIPSNASTIASNLESSSESTDDNEINGSKLRRRKNINVETTDGIPITTNIINSTVENDYVVEQGSSINGSFHENSTAVIRVAPSSISRLSYIIITMYSQIFEDISWWKLFKLVITVSKVITCLTPCSPYLPSSWVFYPILIFAILDLLS